MQLFFFFQLNLEFMTRKASLDRKEREIRAKIEEIATKISQQVFIPRFINSSRIF